eukprot:8005610-Pyramimonas_sp.AAC.1
MATRAAHNVAAELATAEGTTSMLEATSRPRTSSDTTRTPATLQRILRMRSIWRTRSGARVLTPGWVANTCSQT